MYPICAMMMEVFSRAKSIVNSFVLRHEASMARKNKTKLLENEKLTNEQTS
jgi:hypothetical protein